VAFGGKHLPPQQRAVALQQWRQARVGWRLAAWQLPPHEMAAACSQPPLQNAVGVFGFVSFFFFVFFLVFFLFSII
jgi:hypothetical protein